MLDGEESEIMFVDHPADEMTVSEPRQAQPEGMFRKREEGDEKCGGSERWRKVCVGER